MALFDSIGKKLTNAGQNVAQQTKSFTETAKLNSQISTYEKKISELFLSLGRACYERHRDDKDTEYRSIIDEINTIYEEIAEAQEQIKQIKDRKVSAMWRRHAKGRAVLQCLWRADEASRSTGSVLHKMWCPA